MPMVPRRAWLIRVGSLAVDLLGAATVAAHEPALPAPAEMVSVPTTPLVAAQESKL